MDISITSKYDVFTECIFLLERRNLPEGDEFPKTIYDVIQKICEKYNIPFEEFSDEIYILAEVENFIMDNLEIEEKKLLFYFGIESQSDYSLAWALYYTIRKQIIFNDNDYENPHEFDLRIQLIGLVLNYNLEGKEIKTEKDLNDFLRDYQCTIEDKWLCTQVFYNAGKFQKELLEILEEVSDLFNQKANILQSYIDASAIFLKEYFLKNPESNIMKQYNLQLNSRELIIIPSAMGFNTLKWDHMDTDGPEYLYAGIMYHKIGSLIQKYNHNEETLLNRLKLLSDKRRLEILKALKNGPLCGQDISQLLSLTPATVSHHMNFLVNEGFVRVQKTGVRIDYYYVPNEMNLFMKSLNNVLL
ncbi:ArsR/SmtB family transcription factor [Niallia sp. Sow4_A1]|uniref:ArsR/SmtB family transcription factor n=1 Tax=Bacillaceae TaxID=186817 RepID=UPI0004E2503B|nr:MULTISPECIES: metalloregulator ArsR/SmtB family transcription factor [Bacillaceae]MCM3360902.1 metalloregulator ArsR/SmtB family transcription factor [Niallia sp. MER TA 168]